MHGTREAGKLLCRPVEHISGKQSSTGTQFDHIDAIRRIESTPHLLELACQQPSKYSVNVTGGVEVAGLAELLSRPRIVAKFGVIEAQLHVTREAHRTVAADLIYDELP